MFLPYSSDIYEEYRPWMAYPLFIVIVLGCFVVGEQDTIPEIRDIYFTLFGNFHIPISPLIFLFFSFNSFFFLWIFNRSVCSKIGNFIYLIVASIPIGLYILIQMASQRYFHLQEVWYLSSIVGFLGGMYLVFWPSNTIDCAFLLPPLSTTFSVNGYWVVLYWLFWDAVFSILFKWFHALYLHPMFFFMGIVMAILLIRIRAAIIPRDESSLWDVLFRRKQEEESWKYSWKERKSRTQQEQEKQDFKDEQLMKKLESSGQLSKSSSSEQDTIYLCDCGQIIILKEPQAGQETFCLSCGKKLHKGHRQK
jgi:hypothetical protein